MLEETGIADAEIGSCVATQSSPITWFRRKAFTHARYFLLRTRSDWFDSRDLAATEDDAVLDIRWWPLDELEASGELMLPAGLPALVRSWLRNGAPPTPVILG